jgi:hypothetical protein
MTREQRDWILRKTEEARATDRIRTHHAPEPSSQKWNPSELQITARVRLNLRLRPGVAAARRRNPRKPK